MVHNSPNLEDAENYIEKGKFFQKEGELEDAADCYQKAIQIDPKSFWGYHLLGCVLEKQGKRDEAISSWKRAIAVGSNDSASSWTYYHLASILRKKDNFEDAINYCQKAILLNPGQHLFYEFLAELYVIIGKLEQAIIFKAFAYLRTEGEVSQSNISNLSYQFGQYMLFSKSNFCLSLSQQKIFASPLNISMVGTSASISLHGYTKYLLNCLNSQIKTSGRHQLNRFCLGDSSSMLGCFYSVRQKIAEHSDLILFDFCINDRDMFYGAKQISKNTILKAVEGFIRYNKSLNPSCRIVVFNLTSCQEAHLNRIEKRECEVSKIYNLVMSYYKVPVIDIPQKLIEDNGRKFFEGLYDGEDVHHPSMPLGSKVVGDSLADELSKINLIADNGVLPEPLCLDNYSNLKIIELEELQSFTLGPYSKEIFQNRLLQEEYLSLPQNSSIEFDIKGTLLGLYYIASSTSGYLTIQVGGYTLTISLYSTWNSSGKTSGKPIVRFLSLAEFELMSDEFQYARFFMPGTKEDLKNYKPCHNCAEPKTDINGWKLNIISLVYQGTIRCATTVNP